MELQQEFDQTVEKAQSLPQKPTSEELLKMYGLFKQATVGDNNEDKPGGFDFKAAAKHSAWEKEKGKTTEGAMQEYIDYVNGLFTKYQ